MSKEILRSGEFMVEVWENMLSENGEVLRSEIAEGWSMISGLVESVQSVGLDSKEVIVDFVENSDLDVIRFFMDWKEGRVNRDLVIALGGNYGLRFRNCIVRDIVVSMMDSGSNSPLEVSVVISYDDVEIVFRTGSGGSVE
jgi:L-cysteine desulfidase